MPRAADAPPAVLFRRVQASSRGAPFTSLAFAVTCNTVSFAAVQPEKIERPDALEEDLAQA